MLLEAWPAGPVSRWMRLTSLVSPGTSRLDPPPIPLPAAGLSQALLWGWLSALVKTVFCLFDLHRFQIVTHWLILNQKNG